MWGTLASAVGSYFLDGAAKGATSAAAGWMGNTSRESLNKNITKSNFKIQKKYDLWTQEQDKAYNKWWQEYLYQLQNNQYYDLSKKYATNTAKWAVEGLKNAGLNPILAAGNYNMSSNLGNASPMTTPSASTARGSIHSPSVSSAGPAASVNAAALSQIQNTSAQTARAKAETDNINADTDIKKFGGGEIGSALYAMSSFLDAMGLKDPLKKAAGKFQKPLEDMVNKASNWLTQQLGVATESGSTAKQSETLPERFGSWLGRVFSRDKGNGVGTADPAKRAAHKAAVQQKKDNISQSEIEQKKREMLIRQRRRSHTPWIFR